jgi:hypothetical protein
MERKETKEDLWKRGQAGAKPAQGVAGIYFSVARGIAEEVLA